MAEFRQAEAYWALLAKDLAREVNRCERYTLVRVESDADGFQLVVQDEHPPYRKLFIRDRADWEALTREWSQPAS